MPIRNPADLIDDLPEKSCLMGLDAGEKTIGMAVSDPGLSIASPLDTVRRGRKAAADYDQVVALAKARNVGGFVLGMPVNMDGTAGPAPKRPGPSRAIFWPRSTCRWSCGTNVCRPRP